MSSRATNGKFIGWAEIGGAKMEEGVTIAKVPAWMVLKPEMMPHLIRAHLDRRRDSHIATQLGIRN